MKKLKILAAFAVCFAIAASLMACGNDSAPEGFTSITFWAAVDENTDAYYSELVDTYNNGQGKEDLVYVKYQPRGSDYSSNVGTTLSSSRAPEVMVISDKYFKNYAAQNYFTNIDELLANDALTTKDDSGQAILDLSDIPSRSVDRFRLNVETREAGTGTTLYGIPNGDNPTIIYYNTALFDAAGINMISVLEEDLDEYNRANGTSYMPHGYAEYTVDSAPAQNLKTSKDLNGETVVKVFNDLIPMNWEELRCLSYYFTPSYNSKAGGSTSTYGFLNEWWFSYGWSVGGDCVGYDEEQGQYIFTLGDENPNYLAVNDVTVNGTAYKAGEILLYADRTYVAEQNAQGDFMSSLYELPSQYEAFAEFCALSQTKGVSVDNYGKTGYGISPSPSTLNNQSKVAYFTSGSVAMVCDEYVQANTIAKSTLKSWDVAPLYQYREYVGGSTYTDADGEENLKVIGATYDGQEYTGELATAESGTPLVGYQAASSLSSCYVIPAKAGNHEAAWKFIQYAASAEGQAIVSQGNTQIPNQISYSFSDEFCNRESNLMDNILALSDAATYTDIGDWSYLEDGEWVNDWANVLNTDVRNGAMKLDTFFLQVTTSTNNDLSSSQYKIRITTK